MFAIQYLKTGDKVTVRYRGKNYSSVVQDMPAQDKLVIAQPTKAGISLDIGEGEQAEIFFKYENGARTFTAVQESRYEEKGVPMLKLRAASEVKRCQRRNWYRLEKTLPVQLSVKDDENPEQKGITLKARTINISGGGCKIAIKQPVEGDARLECRITLSKDTELKLDGKVVWVEQLTGSEHTNLIGVQFAGEDANTQKQLVSYVTNEQRKQIKNK